MSDTSDTESVTKPVLFDMDKINQIYLQNNEFLPAYSFTSMVMYALKYIAFDEREFVGIDEREKKKAIETTFNKVLSVFSLSDLLNTIRRHHTYSEGTPYRLKEMDSISRDVFTQFAKIKGWNLHDEKQREDLAARLDISVDKLDKLTNRMEAQDTLYLFSKLRKEIVLPKTDMDLEKIVDYGNLLFHRINHDKASCEDVFKIWNGIVLPDSMSDEEWADLTASGRYDKEIKTKDYILYKFMVDAAHVKGEIIHWLLRAIHTSYYKEVVLESQDMVMNRWQEYITTMNVPLAAAMALTASYQIPDDDCWNPTNLPPGFKLIFNMLDKTLTLTETSKAEKETTMALQALLQCLVASGKINVKYARKVAHKHNSVHTMLDQNVRHILLGH